MKSDVQKIAENTGFSEQIIQEIKDFIFMDTHNPGEEEPKRFDASYEMAQSWQRLLEGKNIQPHDLTMLNHEAMERRLMLEGMSQEEAHIRTSKIYHYAREAHEYYDKIKKYSKDG